jgi:hypothetical protein
MRNIFSRPASILAAAAMLFLAPLHTRAQSADRTGPFFGFGAGAARIAEPTVNAARFAPSLTMRAGWRIAPKLAVMLETAWNGIGSHNPAGPNIDPGLGTYGNRQLNTVAVLASAQLGSDALYVRPGIGAGQHAFTSYRPLPADGFAPETSREAGAAASLAVGRYVSAVPGFGLNVEAVAIYTSGEDSSSPRWSAGVQFVRVIGF